MEKSNLLLLSLLLTVYYNIIVSPIKALRVANPTKVIGHKYNRKNRREFLLSSFLSASALIKMPQKSNAACLTGDVSEECIGVYKVPLDPEILPYIETPEQLAKFAPDIKWVPPITYPKSYDVALQEFNTIGNSIKDVTDTVSKGSLTAAGVQLLQVMPKYTVCGKVILNGLSQRDDIQGVYPLIVDRYNILFAQLYSCDVMIGQGLRGEMGVSAVAQINILSELKQIESDYDVFLKQVISLSS